MMTSERLLRRPLAIALALLVALPFAPATANAQETTPTSTQQSAPAQQQETTPTQQQGAPSVPPPLPNPNRPNESAPVTAPAPANMQPPPAQQPAPPAQPAPPTPVGTAAAPYEKSVGVAASRPAGVVIAPAKQRRTRSFLIRTGLLIGAAIAVGTVVALSNASPSQPH
jgi:hypothetical protein